MSMCLKELTGGGDKWGYRSSPGFEGSMDLGLVERLPGTGANHGEKCGDYSISV